MQAFETMRVFVRNPSSVLALESLKCRAGDVATSGGRTHEGPPAPLLSCYLLVSGGIYVGEMARWDPEIHAQVIFRFPISVSDFAVKSFGYQ